MSCGSSWPAEHVVGFVASWAAAGGVCGYVIWAFADWFWPDPHRDLGRWTQIGAGVTGVGAFVWTLAEATLN